MRAAIITPDITPNFSHFLSAVNHPKTTKKTGNKNTNGKKLYFTNAEVNPRKGISTKNPRLVIL
ncbi:hypothetical protein MASR2M41_13910 [Flammeovirgaceae bacterium]